MNWNNLYNIDPNDPWAMPSFWKANLSFENLELSPFKYYETVISPAEINAAVSLGATGFQVPNAVNIVTSIVWDYGQGKLINKVNEKQWVRQYCSEVTLWMYENARYLQAYERDINRNYSQKDTDFTDSQGNSTNINTSASNSSSGQHNIADSANASSAQNAGRQLGDTMDVVNNQTTATKVVATSNQDDYSKGDRAVSKSNDASGSNGVSTSYSEGNGASQGEARTNGRVKSYGNFSPLTAMNQEKNFPFMAFMETLFPRLDYYFTVSGYDYD